MEPVCLSTNIGYDRYLGQMVPVRLSSDTGYSRYLGHEVPVCLSCDTVSGGGPVDGTSMS